MVDRISYWWSVCGMPDEVHSRMHTLRVWRNASVHHDEDRWAQDGPRNAEAASRLVAELDALIRECSR